MYILDIMCGNLNIPEGVLDIISMVLKALYVGILVILIIWGILDLGKSIISQKEDEIKKYQRMFFKRLISAILVFFIPLIVLFVVNVLTNASLPGLDGINECINDIIYY